MKLKCLCGCGQYLKPNYIRKPHKNLRTGIITDSGDITGVSGYGYADNNAFNTLRCGFRWALRRVKKYNVDNFNTKFKD